MPAASGLGPDDLVLCRGSLSRCRVDELAHAASAAGFAGVSLYHHDLAGRPAAVRRLLDDHGLVVAELDGPMRWLPGDDRGPTTGEMVDAAAELGARSITVLELTGRRLGGAAVLGAVAEAFGEVCDLAAGAGLLAHLEYYPLSGISDLRIAAAVARVADRPNGGVTVDTWHHLRGRDAGRVDIDAARDRVVAVQLGDVAERPGADLAHEMMHGRLLPGDGAGNVAELVQRLVATGCQAPIGVEVYSDRLAGAEPLDVARSCADAARRVVGG